MQISIIVAMGNNRVIGKDNAIPWRLPADLKHFKEITMGKPILMGRKTFESIGKPLPGRHNIIITRDRGYRAEGCSVAHSIESALALVPEAPEVMVIGGANLYAQFLPLTDRIYLTQIDQDFAGDTWFPELAAAEWGETARTDHLPDEKNPFLYSFVVLERRH